MNHKLSVIIPIYNVEEYLEQCIESTLNQKYSPLELILIDDGSTDGSGSICDQYAKKNQQVKVLHQMNQGHTIARQNGFRESDGDYIIFIDSDDWIEEQMFTLMMNRAVNEDADIVQCGFKPVKNGVSMDAISPYEVGLYNKKRLQEIIYPTMIYNESEKCFGVAPNMWNKIFRRALVEKYIYKIDPRIRSGEDGLLTYACFLEAEKIYNLKECLYCYRSREVSMCRILDDKRLDENHLLFQYYQDWFMPEEILQNSIKHYVVNQTLQAVKALNKKKSLRQIKKEHPYLRSNSLERSSIRDVSLNDISGKKNKILLAGLKL